MDCDWGGAGRSGWPGRRQMRTFVPSYCSVRATPPPRPTPTPTATRSHGVCLRNCQAYGSQAALRLKLWSSPKLIVGRDVAKEFKYVKMCLIML